MGNDTSKDCGMHAPTVSTLSANTAVPLRLVAAIVAATVVVVGTYLDIKHEVQSMRREITGLRREMAAAMNDRWTKADDAFYMYLFCRENSLACPPHIRHVEQPAFKEASESDE